ncbi:hypothetical protein Tco_1378210 [Tanacetum coccineum]
MKVSTYQINHHWFEDDVGEEEAIKINIKVVNNNNEEDESIEVDEIVNIKESKNHPIDQVIGNLNQRTLSLLGFLWCNGEYKRGKAKVAWDVISLPKTEGGLGIRSLEMFNIALMTKHIWNIISIRKSLWLRWTNIYQLCGHSFWDIPIRADASWSWRNPLAKFILPRDVSNAGFNMSCKVADFVANKEWHWPQPWLLKAPNIGTMSAPILDPTSSDLIQWKNRKGVLSLFSVSKAWEELRPRGFEVWYYVRLLADLENVPPLMHLILIWLISIAHQRSARSIIRRLVVAATTYFLWSKRNNRLFKNSKRSLKEVWDVIMTMMKQALIDYGIRLDDVPIMCDNKGAIDLSKNPVQHSRTKHIEIRHHFLRNNIQKGKFSIEKVASEDNIADIFTKPLKREVFNYLRLGLGMMELIMDSDSPSS